MFRPVHFEIHGSDPAALRTFYETLFGWRFQQWGDNPYWMVITGDGDPMDGLPHSSPGIDGGLLPRPVAAPHPGQAVNAFVLTVEVPNCDVSVAQALEAGGSIAVPAEDMSGVGRLAYIRDPDGNLLGLLEPDTPEGPVDGVLEALGG